MADAEHPKPPPKAPVALPRVAITFCTQCRWMLRAAYFAQELLSTFGSTIGEVALIPATGGVFRVELTYAPQPQDPDSKDVATGMADPGTKDVAGGASDPDQPAQVRVLLWDRKAEGGFPETKVLKQLVRDHLDSKRDLGHSDKHGKGGKKAESAEGADAAAKEPKKDDVSGTPVAPEKTSVVAATAAGESGDGNGDGDEADKKSSAKAGEQVVEKRSKPVGEVCEDCQ